MRTTFVLTSFLCLFPLFLQAKVRAEMNMTQESFVSPAYDATPKTNYQFLGAELKSIEKAEDKTKINMKAAYAFGAPLASYINVRELYYEDLSGENQIISFGRKKLDWSFVDTRWNLGVWEPQFEWNPLDSERQGLTGLFFQSQQKNFSLTMFVSYLYLPNQGPSFEVNSNGQFERGNPWFQQPPDSIRVLSEVSKIEYHFQKPSESQVVLQPSYGAKVSFGDINNVYLQTSFIYKPMNNLALGYNGVLDIPHDRGSVDVNPQVVFHSLAALDFKWNTGFSMMGIGVLSDRPTKDHPFDSSWTYPIYSDSLLSTVYMDLPISSFVFTLQHLQTTGQQIIEVGPLASARRPSITSQYPYREANEIAVAFHKSLPRGQALAAKLSYTQSDENQFRLVRLDGKYKLNAKWSMQAEAQLVDAVDITVANQNQIAPLVNNDRVALGASYVF